MNLKDFGHVSNITALSIWRSRRPVYQGLAISYPAWSEVASHLPQLSKLSKIKFCIASRTYVRECLSGYHMIFNHPWQLECAEHSLASSHTTCLLSCRQAMSEVGNCLSWKSNSTSTVGCKIFLTNSKSETHRQHQQKLDKFYYLTRHNAKSRTLPVYTTPGTWQRRDRCVHPARKTSSRKSRRSGYLWALDMPFGQCSAVWGMWSISILHYHSLVYRLWCVQTSVCSRWPHDIGSILFLGRPAR